MDRELKRENSGRELRQCGAFMVSTAGAAGLLNFEWARARERKTDE
jgi:hypothetical protein